MNKQENSLAPPHTDMVEEQTSCGVVFLERPLRNLSLILYVMWNLVFCVEIVAGLTPTWNLVLRNGGRTILEAT